MRVAVALASAFALSSCVDAPPREKLTVLVEADRARALEDQARLADMQRALDDAKHDLVELRERLLRAGALTADENKRLEEREAKLAANAVSSSTTSSLSKADVETLLRASEDRMRASCAPAANVPAPVAPSTGAARDDVATELEAARQLMATRGLLASDVPDHDKLQQRIDDDLRDKRFSDAVAAARALRDAAEHVAIDGPFVSRKYARAEALVQSPRLSNAQQSEVKRLLLDASRANGLGHFEEANAKLSQALQRQ